MQRYWWPGYELKLLEKLQRQQNDYQFCDTLLQCDGISIPTHSCILAALSPYLSERLLASPSPPFGQKRQLKLHTVKAQTLLKLVALIYSGEVEVNVGVEQSDLLAAAIKFGITDLVEGQRQAGSEERCHQGVNCQSLWDSCEGREGVSDAQAQAETIGRREMESPERATSWASVGAAGKTPSALDQEEGPSRYTPGENVDYCVTSTPRNLINEDNPKIFWSERIPSSVSSSDRDSELNCSLNTLTDCTTSWSVNVATSSFDSDSNGRVRQGVSDQLQSLALTDMVQSEDQDAVPDAAEESRTSAEQPKRAEMPEVERVKSAEERSSLAGRKNLDLIKQMAQMAKSTQISIKVKLVRIQGEVWEVADMQNTETLSVLSSLKQTALHSDSESSSLQSSPASKPKTPTFQPATADASETPPLPSLPSPPPCTAAAPQFDHDPALAQSDRPCSEESDEQMEVLLEDIMMGLNILPSDQRSCRNPALPQPSQDRAQVVCPARVPEERQCRRDARAAAGDAGLVYHQDYRTQVGLCSVDTDQTQSSSFSPSSLQRDAPSCCPPESLLSQRVPTSPTNTPTTESRSCSFAGSPAQRPVTPVGSVCGDLSTQDREDILELLPPAGGNSERSSPSASLSAIGDLRLPQFLSPLRPVASAGKPRLLFQGTKPCRYRTHSNLRPPGRRRLPTESPETQLGTSRQTHANVKSQRHAKTRVGDNHRRMSEDEPRGGGGGGVAAQLVCKKRSLRRAEEAYVWQVRDGVQTPIQLSACSVSLSSKNVLAKERELAVSSSGKFKGTQSVTDSSKIQTRGFLKKIQEASCQTKAIDPFVPKAAASLSDAVDNGEVAPLKRKRGRPFSKRGRPKKIVAGAGDAAPREQQSDRGTTPGDGGVIKTKRKRRRKTRDDDAAPHKRTRRAGKAVAGENQDVALATKRSSPQRTRKMKRKFTQCPKSTITGVNANKDEGANETERHEESSDYKLIEGKVAAENQDVLTPAVDENSNPVENTEGREGNSCSFTGDEGSLQCDKLHGDELHSEELHSEELHSEELQVDELQGEEVGQIPAETTELLQNLREGQRSGSDSATQNNTLPQRDKSLSDCNPNPEISPQPHQVPFHRPRQHEQVDVEEEKEEEEKEEEEIEVVLCSPVPQHRVCENILDNMDSMLQVEEEEEGDDDDDEELSEIDVTGDEAE